MIGKLISGSSQNAEPYYNRVEMTPEEILLQRARQFEEAALVEIYDRFSPGIYRYSFRLLGDVDLAEDCVSETFSRLLRSLRHGKGPRQYLQAYLYQIAHHWITDHFRSQPAQELLDVDDLALHQADESDPDWTEIAPHRLRSALAALTPDQRQVIVLKYLEDMDNATIARVVQKPVGAVKSLQHRAINSLRRLLSVDLDGNYEP